MKYFIFSIILVVVAGLTAINALQPEVSFDADHGLPDNHDEVALISTSTLILVTDAGFSPSQIAVPLGTTVIFKNIDTDPHWPASDPHPAHTTYSEFDPHAGLAPGASWSFEFDKVGVWHFHDHKNPISIGTVTVLAAGQDPATVAAAAPAYSGKKCPVESTDFYCYESYYQKIVREKGTVAAFVDLKKAYEGSSYIRSQCHPLTHVIGRAATKLYPKVSEAYTHGDSFCWSGYYHGVMEGIIGRVGIKNIMSQLSNICADIPTKAAYSFDYYNCVHGLGHGLMALTENELFDSLKLCDNLTGQWEKTSCYGGVFMENVIADGKDHSTKYLKPSAPLYPCNAVDTPYKESCYLMQTSYMLKVVNYDFAKVFQLCRNADSAYRNTCFVSLGRDASGQSISNAERTRAVCDMGTTYEEKSNCLTGAVKDFVSYYHSDTQARQLCSMFSAELAKMCNETVTTYYATF